jgi:hypothetical protein
MATPWCRVPSFKLTEILRPLAQYIEELVARENRNGIRFKVKLLEEIKDNSQSLAK